VSKEIIDFAINEPVGTIIISNGERTLIRVLPNGKAEKYLISVGRDGFTWTGVTRVGRKVEWPAWRPPSEMRKRQPDLPDYVPPGPYNPLGARALYLHSDRIIRWAPARFTCTAGDGIRCIVYMERMIQPHLADTRRRDVSGCRTVM
jgi:hypothetical protein